MMRSIFETITTPVIGEAFDKLSESTLEEMPMSNVHHLGDWEKNSSFRDQDRKLLNNPKAIRKVKAMWKYPEEVDYNVLLVNNKEARQWTEVGLVDEKRLEQMFPTTFAEMKPLLVSNEVNIIFTNNNGSERVPLTGWVMAHRFGHAIFRQSYGTTRSFHFNEAANELSRYLGDLAEQYGIPLNGIGYGDRNHNALLSSTTKNLMTQICTFKSARDNNLRDSFEALYELFAQYILTGRIKFNDIPLKVKVKNSIYAYRGGDDYASDNHTIQHDLADELESHFETAIYQAAGKIFVM